MDLDRITHPLRLAKGSHQPGSGKGCAMNVISYINGDARVTDFPACSARPLAAFVQSCNDLLAGPGDYLSPQDSMLALDLGWQTVGTAGVARSVVHAWVAELLTSPSWGVVQYVRITTMQAIYDIAELHRRAARADMPSPASWEAAYYVVVGAARSYGPASALPGAHALQAAWQSTLLADDHRQGALDAVTGSAVRAHALATGTAASDRFAKITGCAIASWRHLARLDDADRFRGIANQRSVRPVGA